MKNILIMLFVIMLLASSVNAGYCGDGSCNASEGENADTCPQDCEINCGNGICSVGENSINCAADCEPFCGNRVIETGEQCDDGSDNSETHSDHCRTNCYFAYCGDGVADTGEECDGFVLGDLPNKCREDCTMPYCGDGIVDDDYLEDGETNRQGNIDPMFNEECDDGNNDNNDGCTNDCKACLPVHDDLWIYEDPGLPLCAGEYTLQDNGEPGIIQVQGFNFDLDCNNAVIIGAGVPSISDSISPPNAQAMQNVMPNVGGAGQEGKGYANVADAISPADLTIDTQEDSGDGGQAGSNNQPPDFGDQYTLKRGIGIVVKGNAIVLKNCDVRNFNKGIKFENGGNMLFQSRSCGNTVDIISVGYGNFGVLNECDRTTNWYENGNTCKTGCDGQLNTPVPAPDAPVCECAETTSCDGQDQEEEEEAPEEEKGFFGKLADFFFGKDDDKLKAPLVQQEGSGGDGAEQGEKPKDKQSKDAVTSPVVGDTGPKKTGETSSAVPDQPGDTGSTDTTASAVPDQPGGAGSTEPAPVKSKYTASVYTTPSNPNNETTAYPVPTTKTIVKTEENDGGYSGQETTETDPETTKTVNTTTVTTPIIKTISKLPTTR